MNVQAQQVVEKEESSIQISYLKSKDEFRDYILDTGDSLEIEFVNSPRLSGLYTINPQGEKYILEF